MHRNTARRHPGIFPPFLLLMLVLSGLPGLAVASDFQALDIKERGFDGAPAIGIVFSAELAGDARFREYLSVERLEDDGSVSEWIDGEWVLSDNKRVLYFSHIEPDTRYRVAVEAGLPAANGQQTAKRSQAEVKTRPIVAGVSFRSSGLILPKYSARGLPVTSVNVPEVDVDYWRIDPQGLATSIDHFARNPSWHNSYLDKLPQLGQQVHSGRYQLNPRRNQRGETVLPVAGVPALAEAGLYVAVMQRSDHYDYSFPVTAFIVSDLAVVSREYPRAWGVFVNRMSDAGPVAQANVQLLNDKGEVLDEATTDTDGGLRLLKHEKAHTLKVSKGDDFSLLPLRGAALDMSEFQVDGPLYQRQRVFVWGPRDLYRPGESISVAALLRDDDGRFDKPQPLYAKLIDPRGEGVENFTWRGDSLGYYQRSLSTSRDSATGTWTLELRTDPASPAALERYQFKLEEFLPERMKLELVDATPADPPTEQAGNVLVDVQGDYLYGAPASGNRMESTLLLKRNHYPSVSHEDFFFGDADDGRERSRTELEVVKLDAEGHARLTLEPEIEPERSVVELRLAARLLETGGRAVSRVFSRNIWPRDEMLGIRPLWPDAKTGEPAKPDQNASFAFVWTNQAGESLPVSGLTATLIREEREYYWVYQNGNWSSRHSSSEYPVFESQLEITPERLAQIEVPLEWGGYRVEVRDADQKLLLKYRFRAGWSWQSDDQAATASLPDRVKLGWDADAYGPGQTASLSIHSPHDGQALVLVESDQLLWRGRVAVRAGENRIDIPVAQDWQRHDIYATVVSLKPGAAEGPVENRLPGRAMGSLHLPLERASRELALTIEAPDKSVPEKNLEVRLKLASTPQDGEVNVTLAAVDVGVLYISRFETPDAHADLFQRLRLNVDGRDSYSQLIKPSEAQLAALRFGGDLGLAGGKRPDPDVQIVSLFQGPVAFDDNGEASVQLALPAFNGTLRLMALAYSKDSYGHADREMIVAAPVVMQASLPRVLARGDQSHLQIDLHNLSGAAVELSLELEAEHPLSLEAGSRILQLAEGEKTGLTIPIEASGLWGTGAVTARLSSGDYQTERRWELAVRPAWPASRTQRQWLLAQGEQSQLGQAELEGMLHEGLSAELSIGSRPPLNARSALQDLLAYPYGCLEQTTSRAFPLLYAEDRLVSTLNLEDLDLGKRAEWIRSAIKRVLGMQLPNGGFSLWGDSGHGHGSEQPWLTPYATEFLLKARHLGYAVDDDRLVKALKRLSQYLVKGGVPVSSYGDGAHLRFAARAYAGYVLSLSKSAPLSALRRLLERNASQARSSLPLLHLGYALRNQGDEKNATKAFELAGKTQRAEHYLGDYGSELRDLAMEVALTMENGGEPGQRLIDLNEEVRGTRWFSTQEQGSLFRAAYAMANVPTGPWQASLSMGNQTSALEQSAVWRRALAADALESGIEIRNNGDESLYLSYAQSAYPEQPPERSGAGASIQRDYYDADGNLMDTTQGLSLSEGDLVIVRLQVSAEQALDHALVADLAPGGLEIENLNLLQGEGLDDLKVDGKALSHADFAADIEHVEYRNDRFVAAFKIGPSQIVNLFYLARAVTPGEYLIPPALMEDMYRPSIRATGGSHGGLSVSKAE
ncbi:MAG: alpha-2-macroglobulin family protein [Gammaproteobacteria bacterium]